MKNLLKNIIVLFLIPVCIPAMLACLCLFFLFSLFSSFKGNAFLVLFSQYCQLLLILFPAILIVFFVNKFVKNRKIKLTSLFICLYSISFLLLGCVEEYIFLPFTFFATGNILFSIYLLSMGMFFTFFVPQRMLDIKYDAIIFMGKLLLSSVAVFLLTVVSILVLPSNDEVWAPIERYKLSKYEKVLSYLETEKTKNGSYPKELNYPVPKIYASHEYKVSSDFNSYIFCADKGKVLDNRFCYCSNEKDEYCTKKTSDFLFKKVGKWTAIIWAG